MRVRCLVFALAILAPASAWGQSCDDGQAALYRHAIIACDGGSVLTPDQPLPQTCGVAQTVPVCPAGFANPISSDVAGVWHGQGVTLLLRIDDNGGVSGSFGSAYYPGAVTRITSGAFDPASRALRLAFVSSQGAQGTAALQLSDDDSTLAGQWAWTGGPQGAWQLARTAGP